MASESAVLGTPAIYIDDVGRGYTTEQEEKYQIVYNYTESNSDQLLSIKKGVEILKIDKTSYAKKRTKILEDKICTTDFMVWFIENYPESVQIMQENPKYQDRFK
jgi:predicted glycosyltransferase